MGSRSGTTRWTTELVRRTPYTASPDESERQCLCQEDRVEGRPRRRKEEGRRGSALWQPPPISEAVGAPDFRGCGGAPDPHRVAHPCTVTLLSFFFAVTLINGHFFNPPFSQDSF